MKQAGFGRETKRKPSGRVSHGDSAGDTVRALSRGLELLTLFSADDPALTLSDLCQRSGLAPTTVRRLAKTMEDSLFLVFDSSTAHYYLGPALIQTVFVLESDVELVRVVRPWLERLARDTGESAAISTRCDHFVVVLDSVVTSHPFKPQIPTGRLGSFSELWSVHNKIHLAHAGETVIKEVLRQPITKYTQHTITDPVILHRVLAKVREENVAYDVEEHDIGMCAIAAPVFARDGKVRAALSILTPTERFGLEDRARLLAAVKTAATDLSDYIQGLGN